MADRVTPLSPDPRWEEVAGRLHLLSPATRLWGEDERGAAWLPGARLNLSVTCLDAHLQERGDDDAIHWEGEPGDRRDLTYRELHEQVVTLARALTGMGVQPGERVGLHLGWLPETVVVMLACARIGAVHSIIPSALPSGPLADRLALLDLKVIFTQDGAWRHGTVLPLKARLDDALSAVGSIEHTIVVRRTGMDVAWYEGDRWYHDVVAAKRGKVHTTDEVLALASHHPVASVPIARRGGHPVSVLHGTACVLANAIAVHGRLRTGGPFWCAGDIAWAVTQFHAVYGPLAWGDASVMYEGTLDVPHHRRAWDIVRRYGVETLITSPSVMRTLRGWDRDMPRVDAAPSLRRLATAGEPVEPELAGWIRDAFGADLELLDAWGQLELGGVVRVTDAGGSGDAAASGPNAAGGDGSGGDVAGAALPMPDCGLEIVDREGRIVAPGDTGEVVLRRPWAGLMIGVDGSEEVSQDPWEHWGRHPGVYATGDLALRAGDGTVVFLGRTDEVVSVSGQLVSLREVRDVLIDHPFVAEARVTVRKDVELGRSLVAAVVLTPEMAESARGTDLDAVAVELMDAVREALGGLARPRAILVVDRFGEELGREALSRAVAALATQHRHSPPRSITWEQLVTAAGEG
ncbi:acyl-CoA synthetase [Ornithinimicrobium pratense]|uniref:acetate--CoA ligase n=1 Tax=Ornithinimicrobium pratense TaxID=2593973 RepID=A0A5J6V619_9MICO|nr:AMP-binding protein [Ornithinimicrobium pratense]QFG68482.1 acetate--CoA ligase [Ornithinimicrobium pratense]